MDSAAPVAVARSAGLHTSRIDGSNLRYNSEQPWMPDILICPVPLAHRLLDRRSAWFSSVSSAAKTRPPQAGTEFTQRGVRQMTVSRSDYQLSQLDVLEAESIHVMREVAAEFERPVLLFSGGKDSIVMLALAERAFFPARIPFPVMHVDTGHNFDEVLAFRDRRAGRARRPPDRRVRAGVDRLGPGGRGDRPVGQQEPAADHHAARRDRRSPFRRGLRRRPAG